jgi:biopolymer transport protein ExbB
MRSTNQRPQWGRGLLLAITTGGLLALPAVASAFWNHDWSYRKQITINPGTNGIALKGDLADVPVLVRLHEGVFKFTDANPDGSDLRFVADDDKTPLKFHVEKYDSVFNLAYIWVSIPGLHAADKTTIWMYYGNTHGTSASESRETYDPNQVLVYHFAERGVPAADSTGYANNSTSSAVPDEMGLIGTGAKFAGASSILVPASTSLALGSGGASTLSFWIKPAAADSDAVLYARRDGAHALTIGLDKGAVYVAVSPDSGSPQRTAATVPLGDKAWHHIAVTTGAQITLYVDGAVSSTIGAPAPALNSPASIGGDAATPGAGAGTVTGGFTGEMDEFEISKVARDAAWVQLEAVNQSSNGKLLEFGADEQLSTWSSGYVGIILRSVTLDGWVVIGILAVMGVLSWVVMFRKIRQVLRAAEANRAFNALQLEIGGDLHALNQHLAGLQTGLPEGRRLLVQDAPLFRMFSAGMSELRQRGDAGFNQQTASMSAHSIEAIRARLDSTLVDELDSLDDTMVVLTIAISGGPFLGLLGTVVGVMITFAAIAASGDVNVNSIAPGIAAVYIDTFITRMAENHRPATDAPGATARNATAPLRREPAVE